jgi:hypothetical protein
MAIRKCRECGKDVSSEAKTCPHCGVTDPVKKGISLLRMVLVLFFGFVVYRCASVSETLTAGTGVGTGGASSTAQPVARSTASPAPPVAARNENWRLDTSEDQMTGKPIRSAYAISLNSLALDFPYRGLNYGQLTVRQHPKYGLDVIVSVEKGQLLCGSYDGCTVQVRFDDAPPANFSANGPADHSTTSLFLSNPKRFIAGASKAKHIRVAFSMYQSGTQVLEFSTPAGLEWR